MQWARVWTEMSRAINKTKLLGRHLTMQRPGGRSRGLPTVTCFGGGGVELAGKHVSMGVEVDGNRLRGELSP